MKVLDLGCGKFKYKSSNPEDIVIGIDRFKVDGVDVVWNLENTPLPFSDGEFDMVVANHVLEHIGNFYPLVEELYRIVRKGGLIRIRVPYFRSFSAFVVPDHRTFFSLGSFEPFKEDAYGNWVVKARFKIKTKIIMCIEGRLSFLNILNPFININRQTKAFYEQIISHLIPAQEIQYELEMVG